MKFKKEVLVFMPNGTVKLEGVKPENIIILKPNKKGELIFKYEVAK